MTTRIVAPLLTAVACLILESGCNTPAETPTGREVAPEVEHTAQALCPTGPAFPSCHGNCGHLACSPLDPGACCACDEGCIDREDCCCDYPDFCIAAEPSASCEGACGGPAPSGTCYCDDACTGYGDCCDDYTDFCSDAPSCEGSCGGAAPGGSCYCDDLCTGYGDCCDDYTDFCGCAGGVAPDSADERVQAIGVGPAGEVYVAGTRAPESGFAGDSTDGFLRRLHPDTFATLWDRAVDNCFWDSVNDLTVLPGGDVVVVGAKREGTFASTPTSLLARRYSNAGEMLWRATPETSLGAVVAHAVAIDTSDDLSLVITGAVSDASGVRPLLARLDATTGSSAVLTRVAGEASGVGRGVAVDAAGGVAIVSSLPSAAMRVLMRNRDGSARWSATDVANSEAVEVGLDSSGNVYALATTRDSAGTLASLSRYSAAGEVMWRRAIDITSRDYNPAGGLALTSASTAVVVGAAATPAGVLEPYLVTFDAAGARDTPRIRSGLSVVSVTDVALAGSAALSAAIESTGALAQTIVVREPL